MKIVFFGTPEFAAKNLEDLHNNGVKIVSIITAPDEKRGRGKKILPTAVKRKGDELDIKVLTPKRLDDKMLVKKLKSLNADLFVIVAFRMLPKNIWEIPTMGTINLHTSFLPNYRGSAPINRVLINGENSTGITTFFINEKLDGGKILLQEKIKLSKDTTAAQLHNTLMEKGSQLLIKTIEDIEKNNIFPISQDNNLAVNNAPKISKEITKINWNDSARNIHNLIRGLSPILNKNKQLKNISICPGAWFLFKISEIKEIRTKILLSKFDNSTNNKNMNIETDNKSFLKINLSDGSIFIEILQVAGKKPMHVSEFLLGNKIDKNWKIN